MSLPDPDSTSGAVTRDTRIVFHDGRNPSLEVTWSLDDYLVMMSALDVLAAGSGDEDAGSLAEQARRLRDDHLDDAFAATGARVGLGDRLTADEFAVLRGALTALADDDEAQLWLLMVDRIAILSGPSRPSALAVVAAALSRAGGQNAGAVRLLVALDRAVDSSAVQAAAERLVGERVATPVERALAVAAGELLAHGVAGELFWDEDMRTGLWAAGTDAGEPVPRTVVERALGAVAGVELVLVRADAPSPDAAQDVDPSWVRVVATPAA